MSPREEIGLLVVRVIAMTAYVLKPTLPVLRNFLPHTPEQQIKHWFAPQNRLPPQRPDKQGAY